MALPYHLYVISTSGTDIEALAGHGLRDGSGVGGLCASDQSGRERSAEFFWKEGENELIIMDIWLN